MENKVIADFELFKADCVSSEGRKQQKIKNPQIKKVRVIVQTLDTRNIPFNLENLVLFKKFLSSENRNFFDKDLRSYYWNLSRTISNEIANTNYLNIDRSEELRENEIFESFVKNPIDRAFIIFFSLFHTKKSNTNKKKYSDFISNLNNKANYLQDQNDNNKLINENSPESILIEDLNEFSKKAPFSYFKERVPKEAFLKERKLIEPVLITILNFAYYIIYFLLKLTDSPIVSSVHPKTLKNKLVGIDALLVKFKFMNCQDNNYPQKDELKMIFDFLRLNNLNFSLLDNQETREKINNQTLNLINSLLIFFKRIPNKSKRLISSSQGILEILIDLLVYKNYLDRVNIENLKSNNTQTENGRSNAHYNYRVESLFAKKLISVLNHFDKILIYKTVIMLIDLNKSNNSYLRIISMFNTLIALKSYNNLMCLFNFFDLSNLNLDKTTKLVKKLFCTIPQSMDKKEYFVKLIDCFWDLIIILKNRDKDEKLCGVKDFSINIFTEIIINFNDNLDFSSYLFYKFYYRFFRLSGFAINSSKFSQQNKNNSSKKKKTNKYNYYFFRYFPKNKDRITSKISCEMLCYLKFLSANFSFLIKSKFQKLFEVTDNSLIFQSLIEILFAFSKNKKIEELENLEESKDETKKINNEATESGEEYTKIITETCCLLLENFETKNIAEMFFNYFNSELLENVFDLRSFLNDSNFNLAFKDNPKNVIIEFEIIENSIKAGKKINNNTLNQFEKEVKLDIKKCSVLQENLLYYSNYQVAEEYINVIENLFELNVFNNLEFICAFNEIISKSNFFEKKSFSFLDTLNEENVFLYYANSEDNNKKPNKSLNLDLLKLNFFNNMSEDDVLDFVFKINNFYMILKNKIFQTFIKKAISNENFLCNKEQAFKFVLMILSIIPDKETGVGREGEFHSQEGSELLLNESMYFINEEIIQLVIHILGFILIDVVNSKNETENSFQNIKKKNHISNKHFDKDIQDFKNQDCLDLHMQRLSKQMILDNSEKLISIMKKLDNKLSDCESILETLKILSLQNQNNSKTSSNTIDSSTGNTTINASIKATNSISEKDNLSNHKLLTLFDKIESELKNIYQIDNYNSNFERSFVLYKTYNLLNKEIRDFKIAKMKIKNPSKDLLEKIKILFDIYIGFMKNIDDYFWKIAQRNIIVFFEIFFLFENRNYFELFFNLVNSTIKEIKNLAKCNEYAKKQKEALENDKRIAKSKINKSENSANLPIDDLEINQIIESDKSTQGNYNRNNSLNKMKNKAEIDEDKIKLEKKLNKKQLEINFESQYFLKVIELLESIIKRNKSAIFLFYKHIFNIIFGVFDTNFYTYDAIIISSLFSILGTIISYCGLEIHQELNSLIRTCLNILKNFNENNLIRRACANMLYKILTNCNFLHYQIYAKDIYGLIKLNLDRRIDNDKVVLFFMDKSIKFIKESVYEFYNKEIELELIKQNLIIKPQAEDL